MRKPKDSCFLALCQSKRSTVHCSLGTDINLKWRKNETGEASGHAILPVVVRRTMSTTTTYEIHFKVLWPDVPAAGTFNSKDESSGMAWVGWIAQAEKNNLKPYKQIMVLRQKNPI